ncbi:MAG: YceI family protein, partial [Gemmatimonadetes bacterium]|nr:YceI family protein [Gemmatimonadota bacterium]
MARKWTLAFPTATGAALALALLAVATATPASAQEARYRLAIDERSSLAWWQVSPHLNHLWATTCPTEPSWQPGDDRSAGWAFDITRAPAQGHAAVVDTVHIPLYPRPAGMAQPICAPAVRGEIVAADTAAWRGVHGVVSIRADAFITGLTMRDNFAKKAILQSDRYPDIRFRVDSLIDVQRGDTLTAKAVGRFEFRGVSTPTVVPVKAWREAGGLRVIGKFTLLPVELVEKYKVSL